MFVFVQTNLQTDQYTAVRVGAHMAGERELLECADAMSPYGWFERIMLGVEPYVIN